MQGQADDKPEGHTRGCGTAPTLALVRDRERRHCQVPAAEQGWAQGAHRDRGTAGHTRSGHSPRDTSQHRHS